VIYAVPFFNALGKRVRALLEKNDMTLDDVISYGFSARHWQMIEKGRRINVTTILRICAVFQLSLAKFVRPLNSVVDLKNLRTKMIEEAGKNRTTPGTANRQ
jgi:transcriptional regulator with XRE-family HTH domain